MVVHRWFWKPNRHTARQAAGLERQQRRGSADVKELHGLGRERGAEVLAQDHHRPGRRPEDVLRELALARRPFLMSCFRVTSGIGQPSFTMCSQDVIYTDAPV